MTFAACTTNLLSFTLPRNRRSNSRATKWPVTVSINIYNIKRVAQVHRGNNIDPKLRPLPCKCSYILLFCISCTTVWLKIKGEIYYLGYFQIFSSKPPPQKKTKSVWMSNLIWNRAWRDTLCLVICRIFLSSLYKDKPMVHICMFWIKKELPRFQMRQQREEQKVTLIYQEVWACLVNLILSSSPDTY